MDGWRSSTDGTNLYPFFFFSLPLRRPYRISERVKADGSLPATLNTSNNHKPAYVFHRIGWRKKNSIPHERCASFDRKIHKILTRKYWEKIDERSIGQQWQQSTVNSMRPFPHTNILFDFQFSAVSFALSFVLVCVRAPFVYPSFFALLTYWFIGRTQYPARHK